MRFDVEEVDEIAGWVFTDPNSSLFQQAIVMALCGIWQELHLLRNEEGETG